MFSTIIRSVQKSWNAAWYTFVFNHTNLSKVLANQNSSEADVVKAYLSSWWITRWFFRFFMNANDLKTFDDTLGALSTLNPADSAHPEIFQAVLIHANPKVLVETLNQLNPAYDKQLICTYRNCSLDVSLEDLLRAFNELHKMGILTEYQKLVFDYRFQPIDLAEALVKLKQHDLLTEKNIAKLLINPLVRVDDLAESFVELKKKELFTDEAVDLIVECRTTVSYLEEMKKNMIEAHPTQADDLFRLFCIKFRKNERLFFEEISTLIASLHTELSPPSAEARSRSSSEARSRSSSEARSRSSSEEFSSFFPRFFPLSAEYHAEELVTGNSSTI